MDRSTSSREMPAAQYERVRKPWITSTSSRAGSVLTMTSPSTTARSSTARLAMGEARPQQLDHLIDLVARDVERRHEPERVRTRGVDEQPAVHRRPRDLAGVGAVQGKR